MDAVDTRDLRPVVLHVEDNPSNRKLVELVATRRPGVRLVEVADGASAVRLARELAPRLVLLDLRLPDVPGEEILRRLRADPATAAVKVVVITAEARPAEMTRLIESGADGYLVKPVDVEDLLDLLDEVEARGSA